MEKIRGKYLILNGKKADLSAYSPGSSASLFYEVMRVYNGQILFVNDHLHRLANSCSLSGFTCPDLNYLQEQMQELIAISLFPHGNIKLVVFEEQGELQSACYYTQHKYPSVEEKTKGVHCLSYPYQRPDPNVKKWNETFRSKVNAFIKQHSIYEAILVNEEGLITEGSRSNIFFIGQDDVLYTAPKHVILPGITRKYVLNIARELGIEVKEEMCPLDRLSEMKSCFISGTSPGVLPIRQIDCESFSVSGEILSSISGEYNKLVGI